MRAHGSPRRPTLIPIPEIDWRTSQYDTRHGREIYLDSPKAAILDLRLLEKASRVNCAWCIHEHESVAILILTIEAVDKGRDDISEKSAYTSSTVSIHRCEQFPKMSQLAC